MMENKKVISRSLIVLFLSLSIVYSLTYQKKESLFKASLKGWSEIVNQTWTQRLSTKNSENLNKDSDDVKNIKAPIKNGQILGRVNFIENNEVIANCDLVAEDNVEKIGVFTMGNEVVKRWFRLFRWEAFDVKLSEKWIKTSGINKLKN